MVEPNTTTGQHLITPPPITDEEHTSPSSPPPTIQHQHPPTSPPTVTQQHPSQTLPIPPLETQQHPSSPATSITQEHQSPPEDNFPCQDLLKDENRGKFLKICVPLYEASIKGDWKAARKILDDNQHLERCAITENFETALHVAASANCNTKSTNFVYQLVKRMKKDDLKMKNKNGNTALSLAAIAGNVKIAEIMVDKNKELLTILNKNEMMPLYIATVCGKPKMVNYLYDKSQHLSDSSWTSTYKGWLLLKSVELDRFDIALKILEKHTELDMQEIDILGTLARKPYAFDEIKPYSIGRIIQSITCCKVGSVTQESEAMQLLKKIWTQVVKKTKTDISKILRGRETLIDGNPKYLSRILFVAAEMGNTKFIIELIRSYPDLIWKLNDDGQSIFHIAISHRHESIYNLLHEIGLMKDLITPIKDIDDNNMLHLVGKGAKESRLQEVSGVAFQLQRELLWFKDVESMIPPHHRERKNKDGLTPYELFTRNHKDLVSDGEKWMKGTASKCMVVAALIATIVFGVAYTIPGGYIQEKNKGFPVFLYNGPFLVFVVLDAISLILSTTSILVFLSILTSRYAQKDFLESLPRKLMVGLTTLFLSIFTMMIAFSLSFFVLYRDKFIAIPITITVLSLIPICSYAKLQYPLLMDVFHSIRHSRKLFKPKKGLLYYQNPRV